MNPSGMERVRLGAAIALICLGSAQAGAQSPPQPRPSQPAPAAAAPAAAAPASAAPAPYEPELLRLSGLVGALAYLGDLCGRSDGDAWRAKMEKLLQALGDSDARRQKMAGAFNKGFRDYELAYRSCTDNARAVIAKYAAEGEALTRDVASRYGGG